MSITINSTAIPQPSADGGVKEELKQIYHDRMRLNGTLQRNFFGIKKQATLTWNYLQPSDYQTLIAFFTSGSVITYSNTTSSYSGGSFTFTGLPMHSEDTYLPGSTLLRKLTVVIQEA